MPRGLVTAAVFALLAGVTAAAAISQTSAPPTVTVQPGQTALVVGGGPQTVTQTVTKTVTVGAPASTSTSTTTSSSTTTSQPPPPPPPVSSPPPPAPAGRTLLWSGDVEEASLSDWDRDGGGGEFNSGNADSYASQDFAHSGSWSAKMVQSGGGTRMFRWYEAQRNPDAYYSVWFYFPRAYSTPAGWWNVFQWKSKNTAGQIDPFLLLDALAQPDGSMRLSLYNWKTRVRFGTASVPIPVGRWFKVEAFLHQSASGGGRVVIWQDGVTLFDVSGQTTKFADGDQQWSVNNYSDNVQPQPTVIYADDARIELGAAP